MSEENKKTGLHARLAEVVAAVKGIPKRGKNAFDKYNYTRYEDVVGRASEEMSKRGLTLTEDMVEHAIDEVPTKNGGIQYRASVKLLFTITDGRTGETIEQSWWGVAFDRGDKATQKAATSAMKYWLMKLLMVDDIDHDTDSEASDVDAAPRKAAPKKPNQDVEKAKGWIRDAWGDTQAIEDCSPKIKELDLKGADRKAVVDLFTEALKEAK